ncbi:MAG: hypothetical protein ACPL3E_01100 [Minisyncoccia bacterium]
MDENQNEPKIRLGEALIAGFWFFALPDLIEFLLIFFGLDDFWLSDLYAFSSSQLYLYLKGVKRIYNLVANLLELIPYLGWLPFRTVGFAITVFIENNPKIQAQISKATKAVQTGVKIATKVVKVVQPELAPEIEAVEKTTKIAEKATETLNKNQKM